jgi:lysophospholipase L1-like esterase
MKSTRLLWRTAGITALLATVLFIAGFVYAVQSILHPKGTDAAPAQPTPAAGSDLLAKDKLQIVALGDSLTKGMGDTTGEGYAGKVKKGLQQDAGKPVYMWNFAQNGWRTDQLLAELNRPGSEIPNSVRKADIVLLTIGGNDLFQFGVANNSMNTDRLEIDYASLKEHLPKASSNLTKIIGRLAALNPQAKIVYVALYHPFLDYDPKREGSAIVQDWNNRAFAAANLYPNVTVIPTFDLFQKNLLKYLYSDHFHPNDAGYARMAERVIQALE